MLRARSLLLAVVLAAGCSAGVPRGASRSPSPSPSPTTSPTPSATPTPSPCGVTPLPAGSRVSVVGDSFTSGVPQTGGIGPAGWPAVLGRQTGWRVTTHALPGAGFLSPGLGKDGRPFEGPTFVELAKQVGPSDLVLVFGSLNDLDFLDDPGAAGPYASAVRAVMASVRAKAPRVVVATTFVVGSPTAELRAMGDLLRRLSRGSCTDFLDPLAEGWLRDGHGIGSDGEHPDDSGHVTLAGLWLDDLSRLGIARSLP